MSHAPLVSCGYLRCDCGNAGCWQRYTNSRIRSFKIRLEKFCAGKPLWLTPRLTAIGDDLRSRCANAVASVGKAVIRAVSPDAQTFRKIKKA
ncbi:MAG: hypothetical protein KME46_21935 [Brasilonema angustatum HA4187-MV1]|nr:hypothetical protein [Brasilonema angustatum HA4187-MV1]